MKPPADQKIALHYCDNCGRKHIGYYVCSYSWEYGVNECDFVSTNWKGVARHAGTFYSGWARCLGAPGDV